MRDSASQPFKPARGNHVLLNPAFSLANAGKRIMNNRHGLDMHFKVSSGRVYLVNDALTFQAF